MALLLIVAIQFVFPPQLLHEWACHADTVDSHLCGTEETAISTQHQHCDILQLFFSPYQPERKDFDLADFQFRFQPSVQGTGAALAGNRLFQKNRGPPAVF
jgi:hypothetical protein